MRYQKVLMSTKRLTWVRVRVRVRVRARFRVRGQG